MSESVKRGYGSHCPDGSDHCENDDGQCIYCGHMLHYVAPTAPAHPAIGFERGELSERGIREAFESGRTATVRASIVADRPSSVYTVRVVKIEGDTLYYTTDGIWFTTVDNGPYASWELDADTYSPRSEGTARNGRYGLEPIPAYGQDAARGILAVNPYAEGSREWHAWGLGFMPESRVAPSLGFIVSEVATLSGFDVDDFDAEEWRSIRIAFMDGRDAYAKGWR